MSELVYFYLCCVAEYHVILTCKVNVYVCVAFARCTVIVLNCELRLSGFNLHFYMEPSCPAAAANNLSKQTAHLLTNWHAEKMESSFRSQLGKMQTIAF